jgi:hypothetical protein
MLIPIVVNKDLKHLKYFCQFTNEILIETLDKCDFTLQVMQLAQFMIVNSPEKESQQIVNALMRNPNEINTFAVILFSLSPNNFSESQFLTILKRIEEMKEEMLKIDELDLSNFLSVCAEKSQESHEVMQRFLFFN